MMTADQILQMVRGANCFYELAISMFRFSIVFFLDLPIMRYQTAGDSADQPIIGTADS